MGAQVKVELTEEQAPTPRMWVGFGKSEQCMAMRAHVILLAAKGWE